jgi:hypothetical protein
MTIDAERAGAVGRDELAELEAERSFLLRSLRDLDAEHAAGDVDEHDYATLRDGYTRRAADVLRRIEAGRAALPPKRSIPWSRRAAVIVGVLALGALAGWLVARSSGQRVPDQAAADDVATDDVAATLTRARMLLGSDPVQAIELYGAVLEQRPDDAEAHAYRGWLFYVVSREADDAQQVELVAAAREELDAAIASDPQYADPHCFRAVIASSYDDDADAARSEAEACIALDPPGEVRALMTPFLESLTAATSEP